MNVKEYLENKRVLLSDDEVHIFLVEFNLFNSEECMQFLTKAECERAEKLKVKDKREQFVITRCVLRNILSQCIDKPTHEIHLSYGEHGKPKIRDTLNNKAIEFNISHSGAYALIAITLGNTIGVDIEEINKSIDYQSLAKRFFSGQEISEFFALDKEKQCEVFYCVWSRKEAFIKATGKGIAYGLDQFSVSLATGKKTGLETEVHVLSGDNWFCYDVVELEGYKTALAASSQQSAIVLYQ